MIVICRELTTWRTVSCSSLGPVHPSIHSYLRGPARTQKDREDSCFKRRISTFFFRLKGKTQALLSALWQPQITLSQPPRLGLHIHMHEWTDTSLPLFFTGLSFLSFYSFHIYLRYSADNEEADVSSNLRPAIGLWDLGGGLKSPWKVSFRIKELWNEYSSSCV